MSGFPDRSSSVSTAGYEDGLGRRSVRFNREVGGMLECLRLRAQFLAFEPALRSRAAEIASLDDERFARVRDFERDASGLSVISELVTGHRLIDLLETRHADDTAVSGLDAAFGFLLQAMPALAELHATSITHGAVAPGRIIITPNSQVVLLDSIYGAVLQRLNLNRRTLWTSLGVMAAPVDSTPVIDPCTDVAQMALCGLLLAAGRPLTGTAHISALGPLVREVAELAEIRAGADFAEGVGRFFEATLPAESRRASIAAEVAAAEIRRLVSHIGEGASLNALAELVCFEAAPKPVAPQRAVSSPAAPARVPTPAPIVVVAPAMMAASEVEPPAPEPSRREPTPLPPAAPLANPAAAEVAAPADREAAPADRAAAPAPAVVPVMVAPAVQQPPVAIPPTAAVPPPSFPAVPSRAVAPAPVPRPPVVFAPAMAPPPQAVAARPAQPPPAVVRIKQEPPPGYAPPGRQSESAPMALPARALPFVFRGVPDERRFPWKIAAAALVVLASGMMAGRVYLKGGTEPFREAIVPITAAAAPSPEPAATETTGSLAIDSQPSGARVTLNGKDAGITPLTLDAVAPGRHRVSVSTGSASVERTVQIEAGQHAAISVPVFSGWIAVFAPIRLDVSAGRRSLGTTDSSRILLPPGRHVLTFSNRELGFRVSQTVDIQPGGERVINLRPTGRVNLNASPWAEVWVDGVKAGETPLANLEVPLGTREILFKHPQHGERRLTVTITTSPAAFSVDFNRSPSNPD